ncbi:MAG: hypothetical protein DMG84_03215 [Acidobacteria bacterium]|nr:MAG: hypothetical protein AUI85_03275 [Acidobacteriales bacterium 13_1_40CM_3_55_5]PYX17565.1 MAG: hypothetical protein DMG84_03215 [Acidobacteriota bacterium]
MARTRGQAALLENHEKWGTRVCETDGERRLGAGQASRLSLRGLGAAILWIKALTEGMHSVTGNSKPRAPFQDFTRAIHDLMAVPHSELKKLYRWYLSDSINDPHHHPFAKYAKRMGHPATQTPNTKAGAVCGEVRHG